MTGFVAGDDEAGERLDVVLAARLEVSRSQAAARIDDGLVTIEGRGAARSHRLRSGEHVEVREPVVLAPGAPPDPPPLRYSDDHLLVVAKPAGLVVHPGPGHAGGTLVDALAAAGHQLAPAGGPTRPGVVHRLDRDTSGLLVLARSDRAFGPLVAAIKDRTVARRYLALVAGVPEEARGRIEAPVGRDPRDRKRFAVVSGGKSATTRYRVAASGSAPTNDREPVALLACELETGRTHQIRVHLSALGHPVVGDPTYRPRPRLAGSLGLDRPFLHAAWLSFTHPVTGELLSFAEPLPDELSTALRAAGIEPPAVLPGPEQPTW